MLDFEKIFADELKKLSPGMKVVKCDYDSREDGIDFNARFSSAKNGRAFYDTMNAMSDEDSMHGILGEFGCRVGGVEAFDSNDKVMFHEEDDSDGNIVEVYVRIMLPNYTDLLTNAYISSQSKE